MLSVFSTLTNTICTIALVYCAAGCDHESRFADQKPSDYPFSLTRQPIGRLELPSDEVERIRRLSFPMKDGMTASLMLHLLHAHGLEAKFDSPSIQTGKDVLRLFTNDESSKAFFGESIVWRTRNGIRCAVSPNSSAAKEHHRDQALGIFSELGLPLTMPFLIGEQSFSLRDMLDDSLKNYSRAQAEIEWTAFAYALYLPPQSTWTNKFGESFSFDQLVDAVLSKQLNSGSCAGCHLVWAMIAIARVDQEKSPILSESVRERLKSRLSEIVQAAIGSQSTDGSWGTDWYAALQSSESIHVERLIPNHCTVVYWQLVTYRSG